MTTAAETVPLPVPDPDPGLLPFDGRVVVATGTASGMGAALLDRLITTGAVVHAVDRSYDEAPAPSHPGTDAAVNRWRCDLGDRDAIDELTSRLPDHIDVLVNCAGVPNGGRFAPDTVMAVNWLGLRHLTESLLDRLRPGSAVVHVASTAGRDWGSRIEVHEALMAAATFDAGRRWIKENLHEVGDGYTLSKEAVQYYTMWRAVQLLPRGVRMNSVCPGITDTAIVADFRRGIGDDVIDHAAAVAGRFARPDEMVPAILFLADEASSSYVNGVNLNIDRGTAAARLTGQSNPDRIWSADGPDGPAGPDAPRV